LAIVSRNLRNKSLKIELFVLESMFEDLEVSKEVLKIYDNEFV